MSQEYFASLPPDDLAKDLMGKIDTYYQWLMISGRLGRWRIAFDTYYGQRDRHRSSNVTASGSKGELSFLMSNEYRNLVQHLLVLTTQNRPSIECAAVNTDKASQDQAILGKQLLDYYRREGGLDKNAKGAIEIALVMDTSWVFTEWDTSKGEEIRPDMSGGVVTQGDIDSRVRTPLDVVIDYTRDHGLEHEWQMVRDLVNKFDLAAQYQDKEEDILSVTRDRTRDSIYRFGDQAIYGFNYIDSPLIERFTFFHKKTPSMPQGRMMQLLNGKTWLFDGPIPTRRLPGRRCCPTEMLTSALGYSNTNDLLALQDVMDALVSAAVTNMTSAGINNIWCKPNANLDFEQLSSGMNYIESDDKPEVLMLNHLSPEWFSLTNWIVSRMEAYSGVNSVARGNTEGKDLSGAAMALLQSMAIQFNSGLQQSYNQIIEDINNDALFLLQDYAHDERVALIGGENSKYMQQSFSNASIDKIQRVYCRQSNSMQDTTAGKMVILKDLLSIPNAITNSDQYLQVLQTGQLTPATEDETKKLLLIKAENEALAKGEQVLATSFEDHPRHIKSHSLIIEDMETKKDQAIVNNMNTHIQSHMSVWRQADPGILQALGLPPAPPPPLPPGMPMGPVGNAPGPIGPTTGPGANAPVKPPPNPGHIPPPPTAAGGPVPNPSQPGMPTNPLTHQKWNPTNGGIPQNG